MVGFTFAVAFGATVLVICKRVDAGVFAFYGARIALLFARPIGAHFTGFTRLTRIGARAVGEGSAIAGVCIRVDAFPVALEFVCATVLGALTGIADLVCCAALPGVGTLAVVLGAAKIVVAARVDASTFADDLPHGAADGALAFAAHLAGGAAGALVGGAAV